MKKRIRKDPRLAGSKDSQNDADESTRVVHALNMCMVSLSQIVEYNDINVLRQEYDAILNNLNIEKINKDEPLLTAIKQILDTCHFYILHAKDKEILKKKQAARLKGALGRALGGGNIFAIFGSPNPWAIAASAATMIGIAAVKYKSELDKARLENEIQEWELDKTALEQLHNLRRTLFETSWRLCDVYEFPEGQRMTERIISTYNGILLDPDPVSRYERLELLEGVHDFSAYPIFYYYKGRAALEAGDEVVEAQTVYRDCALKAFKRFCSLRKVNNLLKEDVISASAYLDTAALLKKRSAILSCVEDARKIAGLNVEVIQNCAFRYLLLMSDCADMTGALSQNERERCVNGALWCLRYLVSEDYNSELNGRALSRFYKQIDDSANYAKLKACLKVKHPFVYQWMEPWKKEDLQKEWSSYCLGNGMKQAIAQYVDCRSRLVIQDFTTALNANIDSGETDQLTALVEKKWGQKVEFDDAGNDLKFNNNDPKGALHEMFWYADNGTALRKSIFNGAFALNLIGGTANGVAAGSLISGAAHGIAAGSLAVVGVSAIGLGMIGVLPGVVGAAYALYQNRLSKYGIVNPDSQTHVPSVLKKCCEKLKRDPSYDETVKRIMCAEQEYLNAIALIVEKKGEAVNFEYLESLLREFVMRQADAFSQVIERVLPFDANAISYWMGTSTSSIVPECVRFSDSMEYQTDLMRVLAIQQQLVRDHFVPPRYFERIFPQGETMSYLSPSILFED